MVPYSTSWDGQEEIIIEKHHKALNLTPPWYKVGEGKVKNAGSYISPSNNEEKASWVEGDRTRDWQPYKEHKWS
jgi:hypothetical protein